MVAAPVISIIALAMQPAPDLWRDLLDYVLPRAHCSIPRCCWAASARWRSLIGAGTAWLISLHDFRGRGCCCG